MTRGDGGDGGDAGGVGDGVTGCWNTGERLRPEPTTKEESLRRLGCKTVVLGKRGDRPCGRKELLSRVLRGGGCRLGSGLGGK